MKIEIKGAYGETNFGDDLLMRVFEDFFIQEMPDSKINFVGENQKYVKGFLKESEYLKPNFDADLIVYGGGTQFFSFSQPQKSSLGTKIIKGLNNPKLIFDRLFKTNASPKIKAPIALVGFGIGPFYGEDAAKSIAENSLKNASFVGVRDEVSKGYCEEWNVPAFLGADVVFSSYFPNPQLESIKNEVKKIGIIVRDWNWEQSGANYIDKLKAFYSNNDRQKVELTFIVFAPLKDKKWMDYLENEDKLVWDPAVFSIESFLEKLNAFDGFISARYHGAIIAAILGKPVICVEIEPKLKILTDQVPEFKLWKKPFDSNELNNYVNSLDYFLDYSNSLGILGEKSNQMLKKFKQFINEQ